MRTRKSAALLSSLTLVAILGLSTSAQPKDEPPREWIDADTGHRLIRLSDEPGSQSLYFHQNGYTPDGKKLVITTPSGLVAINLKTRALDKVVEGRANLIMVGMKTGDAYFSRAGAVYAVNLDTKVIREIGKRPQRGSITTINADETLMAGAITEGDTSAISGAPQRNASAPANARDAQSRGRDSYPGKGEMMERRLAARIPMRLITMNVKTGEVKTLHTGTDWFNHIQFSPTDPSLLMFCHEGPWHKVDRIWTIRTDGTGLTKVHTRTMNMEIFGHEYFSADGRTIWYDLQTPRSLVFWVAGYNVDTGQRTWYHVTREEWSVHYNSSPDGKLFAGDGGGPNSVAAPGNGQWIYLFRPELTPDRTDGAVPNGKDLARPGFLRSQRLANLGKHDYSLEPNVTFTPDTKWIVFRSNMHGPIHVYAVEVEKK